MPNFQYTAKDKNAKTISGTIEAANENEVIQRLHQSGLAVVSLKRKSKKDRPPRKAGKVKSDDLVIFSRELATLIDSGISLVASLGILIEQVESPALKKTIASIRQDVESGLSFCESLARHPRVFSTFFVSMVRAGEASGMLNEVLDRVATYLEKTAALTRKVKSSLVYPALVITMAIVITAFLLLRVVPTFKEMFEALGGDLPLPTLILIGVSDALANMFIFIVFGIIVFGFLFKRYINTEKGRYNFDETLLKLPIIGGLIRKVAVAKFSRTLSTLVKSGVSILEALSIVAKTAGNKVVEGAVNSSLRSVRDGEPIAKPLAKSKVFPSMVIAMVGVGEQTGRLEVMLTKIADFYDEQVDAAVAGLTSMIEPLIIAFLGIIIGSIVISLFLPVLRITQLIA